MSDVDRAKRFCTEQVGFDAARAHLLDGNRWTVQQIVRPGPGHLTLGAAELAVLEA